MKKTSKTIIVVVMMTICACALMACNSGKEKTFEKLGMSITLTDEFVEKEYVGYTAHYSSQKVMVITLREDAETLASAEINFDDCTLASYAEIVIRNNRLDVIPFEEDGLYCFEYPKTLSGIDYNYFAAVFKCTDAFWLVQFCVLSGNYDGLRPQIIKYAKSVTFADAQ